MFDLFIRYKINKTNVVSNVLSRFLRNFIIISKNDSKILNTLYEQTVEIIE